MGNTKPRGVLWNARRLCAYAVNVQRAIGLEKCDLRISPQDIVFRLGVLAVFSIGLFWFPIYYWSTYESSGDERDYIVGLFAFLYCPISWVLGAKYYVHVWRRDTQVLHRVAFRVTCSLLLVIILSTLVAFAYRVIQDL